MKYRVTAKEMSNREFKEWVSFIEKVAKENNLMDCKVYAIGKPFEPWAEPNDVFACFYYFDREGRCEATETIVDNLGYWVDFYMANKEGKVPVIMQNGMRIDMAKGLAKCLEEQGLCQYA